MRTPYPPPCTSFTTTAARIGRIVDKNCDYSYSDLDLGWLGMPLSGQLVADFIVEFICNKVLANTNTIWLPQLQTQLLSLFPSLSLSLFAPTSFVFHFDYIVAHSLTSKQACLSVSKSEYFYIDESTRLYVMYNFGCTLTSSW